jgi:predicted transposase/invertase (TIGR01784 family)
MLLTDWNWDDAKEVWQEEAWEEGRNEREIEIARNALAEGFSLESVQKITGLSIEMIEKIKEGF